MHLQHASDLQYYVLLVLHAWQDGITSVPWLCSGPAHRLLQHSWPCCEIHFSTASLSRRETAAMRRVPASEWHRQTPRHGRACHRAAHPGLPLVAGLQILPAPSAGKGMTAKRRKSLNTLAFRVIGKQAKLGSIITNIQPAHEKYLTLLLATLVWIIVREKSLLCF